MEKQLKIDLKQREHLVALVDQAKDSERTQLEEQCKVSEDSILRVHPDTKAYLQLSREAQEVILKIRELEERREDLAKSVQATGIEQCNSGLRLTWRASP